MVPFIISTEVRQIADSTPSRKFTYPVRALNSAAEHLRAWFTPERRKLINASELDRLAGRPVGLFARFLARQPNVVLTRGNGLADYYPFLALLGYEPPTPLASEGKCNLAPFLGIISVSYASRLRG